MEELETEINVGALIDTMNNALIALAVFFALWVIYTFYLFRRRIFKKRYASSPVVVWEEE